jgi:hypothetical protein
MISTKQDYTQIKMSLCVTEYHLTKTYGSSRGETFGCMHSKAGNSWIRLIRFQPQSLNPSSSVSYTAGLDVVASSPKNRYLSWNACALTLEEQCVKFLETQGTTHPPTQRHTQENLNPAWEILFVHHRSYHWRMRRWGPISLSVFSNVLHRTFHLELGQLLWKKGGKTI